MHLIFGAINVALFIAVTMTLVIKYRQSRQTGFLWLLVPLILLPILGMSMDYWVESSVSAFYADQSNAVFPLSLVRSGRITLGSLLILLDSLRHVVWSAFVLFSVLMFHRQPVNSGAS